MIEDVARLRLTVDSTGIDRARGKLNSLSASGNRASGSLGKFNASAKASRLAMGVLAVGVTAVGAAVIKTSRDWLKFNVAMKEVQTIAGVTGKEMEGLRSDALRVAQAIGVDATEAAQGFYQAISAGIPTDKVKEFVTVAAQLGKGGLADIGSSTDLLTTALNSYGKGADKARQVSDQLFRTVKLGKTTIPALASSLARVAPTAAAAGVELEELLGITAATTKQGVKTAESMTQVKAAIVALLNPSETMADIYAKLGVESGRQLIAQEGLAGALQKVRNEAGGNDKVLTQALRSIEAFSLTAAITGEKLDETAEAIKNVGDAAGDTAEASKIAGEELGTAMKKLGNSLLIFAENANQATGASEGLSGAISDFADLLADPDFLDAYGKAILEFPAIFGKFIFFGQNAEQQVKDFDAAMALSAQQQKAYESAISQSATTRARSLKSTVDLARDILKLEKVIAMQRAITESSLGGKNSDREQAALNALTKQLKSLERIGNKRGAIARKELEYQILIERANEKLSKGLITLGQWEEETQNIVQEFEDVKKNIEKAGKAATQIAVDLAKAAQERFRTQSESQRLASIELRLANLLTEETDENIKKLEDKLDLFDELTDAGRTLTDDQQALKNIYEKQLGILREQTKEARKSRGQLDFEELQRSQYTRQEQASADYSRDVGIIAQGEGTPEEQAEAMRRAYEAFRENIKPDEESAIGGGIPKAEDLQGSYNAAASDLALDFSAEDPYEVEINKLRDAEAQKLEIIREATNLQESERAAIIQRIQTDTAQKIKAVEQAQFQERLGLASDFFGNLATTAKAFGEKGAKAAKAFAIVQATIDTYASAVAAYKAVVGIPYVGPALAPVAAAGAIAAGLAQVAAIKAQKYQMGGIVGGSSYGGDQINAKLNSGEMVLNQTQQRNLFAMANNPLGGSNKGGNVTIVNNSPVQIEGEVETDKNGDMKIIIAEAVQQAKIELTNEAQEGGGTFFPVVEQSYGLRRNPT
jgi:TP901 family phage tail tape measure protein